MFGKTSNRYGRHRKSNVCELGILALCDTPSQTCGVRPGHEGGGPPQTEQYKDRGGCWLALSGVPSSHHSILNYSAADR